MTNTIIPLVYDLLISNNTNKYNWFFEQILKQDDLQSEPIMADSETGTIKSVRGRPPMSSSIHKKLIGKNILGYLFHFLQVIQWHLSA